MTKAQLTCMLVVLVGISSCSSTRYIVLVHGLFGSHDTWKNFSQFLEEDFPGKCVKIMIVLVIMGLHE